MRFDADLRLVALSPEEDRQLRTVPEVIRVLEIIRSTNQALAKKSDFWKKLGGALGN
jgi:hypothetical protein